ncbi:2788_t:CDS:2, partial [Scutellospora calospora]
RAEKQDPEKSAALKKELELRKEYKLAIKNLQEELKLKKKLAFKTKEIELMKNKEKLNVEEIVRLKKKVNTLQDKLLSASRNSAQPIINTQEIIMDESTVVVSENDVEIMEISGEEIDEKKLNETETNT